MRDIPYDQRTDVQKIQSQWNKVGGLLGRNDWSAAIVRCATVSEIAANLVIRKQFANQSTLAPAFVDSLLIWANGIDGKFRRLLIPLASTQGEEAKQAMKALGNLAKDINEQRNAIVHSGAFSNEDEARYVAQIAKQLVESLVIPYEADFQLADSNSGRDTE